MDNPFPDLTKVDIKIKDPNYHPYFKKLFVPFLAILVLTAGLGVSLTLVKQRQNVDSQASTSLTQYAPFATSPLELSLLGQITSFLRTLLRLFLGS